MVQWIALVDFGPAGFFWPGLLFCYVAKKLQRVAQGDVRDRRGLDRFSPGGILLRGVEDEVARFHGSTDDTSTIAVGDQALGGPGPHIPSLFVFHVIVEVLLSSRPILPLMYCQWKPLVLIVGGIAGLRCLVGLSFFDELPNGHLFIAMLLAEAVPVRVNGDREAIG